MCCTQVLACSLRAKLPGGLATHEAMVLGKRFTAEEALHSRIVAKISPRETLMQTAFAFGHSLIKRTPYDRTSLRNMKKDLYDGIFEDAKL